MVRALCRVQNQRGESSRRLRLGRTGSSKRLIQDGRAVGHHLRLPEGQYGRRRRSTAAVRRDVFLRDGGRQRPVLQPVGKECVLCDPGSIDIRLSARLRRRPGEPDVLFVVDDVVHYVTGRRLSDAGDIASPAADSPPAGTGRQKGVVQQQPAGIIEFQGGGPGPLRPQPGAPTERPLRAPAAIPAGAGPRRPDSVRSPVSAEHHRVRFGRETRLLLTLTTDTNRTQDSVGTGQS